MLGRSLPAMRVHVRGLPVREFKRYLTRIGWAGEQEEIAALAQVLLDYGDWVVVCLDILGDQIVRVGVECFFAEKRGLDPRWRPLLQRLADLGLSSADKADALLRWPGTFTPLDCPGRWPEDLIAQSVAQPEEDSRRVRPQAQPRQADLRPRTTGHREGVFRLRTRLGARPVGHRGGSGAGPEGGRHRRRRR